MQYAPLCMGLRPHRLLISTSARGTRLRLRVIVAIDAVLACVFLVVDAMDEKLTHVADKASVTDRYVKPGWCKARKARFDGAGLLVGSAEVENKS